MQNSFSDDNDDNKSTVSASRESCSDQEAPTFSTSSSTRPRYLTVGTGSMTVDAARLQAILDSGSGEFGSRDGSRNGITHVDNNHDQATEADHHKTIHQRWYNQHRASLAQSIERTTHFLQSLQATNATWHLHYPSVHQAQVDLEPSRHHVTPPSDTVDLSLSSPSPFPASPSLQRHQSSGNDNVEAGPSKEGGRERTIEAPRLVTPMISQEFSILKLDLKLGSLYQTELVHSLGKSSIASLLDGQISSSLRHLQSLQDRLEDMSSKVLITGDVNAGKSTFCNALLRRKILPEDQQPCTAIFCEVLDARENVGVEEVHAVNINATYDRNDERTYDVFALLELGSIVMDTTKYMHCKVYVEDVRAVDESLLRNGIVHIALIDAPGLNSHTTKTTAVFARQEEIDVVVFVVSASNHFTISAQDFIKAAAAEKAYLFIVVNGFDSIMDKERCEKMILAQIQNLSPLTSKESSELVHFVSSNAIPTACSGGGSSENSSDDGPSDDPKGKGKEAEQIRDFEKMEDSLRSFVLEKRAISKLAPAKNYLLNILQDVNILALVNREFAQSEIDREAQALQKIDPELQSSRKAKREIDVEIEKVLEDSCKDVYDSTRSTLNSAIAQAGDNLLGVPYPGVFYTLRYAEELKEAILTHIADSVTSCEDYGKHRTLNGVNTIKQLGLLHVTDGFENLSFRPDVMFRRRRDVLARQVDIPTEMLDFIDWPAFGQGDKVASTSVALTVATAFGGRMLGIRSWVDQAFVASRVVSNGNLHRLIVPGIFAAALLAITYVIHQIPVALPRRLSTKVAKRLADIDYVHANALRISGSVRKVLRFPADKLRIDLDRLVQDLAKRRDDSFHVRDQSLVALKYFGNLVRDSAHQREIVVEYNLEAPPGFN